MRWISTWFRTCMDCGAKYRGGPTQKRCDACRYWNERKRDSHRKKQKVTEAKPNG